MQRKFITFKTYDFPLSIFHCPSLPNFLYIHLPSFAFVPPPRTLPLPSLPFPSLVPKILNKRNLLMLFFLSITSYPLRNTIKAKNNNTRQFLFNLSSMHKAQQPNTTTNRSITFTPHRRNIRMEYHRLKFLLSFLAATTNSYLPQRRPLRKKCLDAN